MSGKLIVFEGTDGSGKSTQFSLLCAALEGQGREFKKIVFRSLLFLFESNILCFITYHTEFKLLFL